MDPQQRLMLELAWEALEDAGIPPDRLDARRDGRVRRRDLERLRRPAAARRAIAVARQTFTGTQRSMIANRVSYFLGARGPSLTVDTGQSSGLVAVHMACESLRAGESSSALAGGVNLNVGPDTALELAALGALSPDGRCFTFDARANGFVRGEGGGLVVLKPLDAAVAGGDRILGVIRGSAVNNDGGGDGLTAPDPDAQKRLLRMAYENAGVRPDQVPYVELHGTGTPLGDRVEAAALGSVLGESREGSVAPGRLGKDEHRAPGGRGRNSGADQGGPGARSRRDSPQASTSSSPTRRSRSTTLGLRVQTAREPWPEASPKIAGVSSFGLGGTNCHVVVEAAPEPGAAAERLDAGPPSPGSRPGALRSLRQGRPGAPRGGRDG